MSTSTPTIGMNTVPLPTKPSHFETLAPISAACAVTAAAMYPLDVVRALSMASATGSGYTIREFVKTHGIRGVMSQGVVPEILRATWMRILKFFFFPITFEAMYDKPTSQGTPFEKAIAAAIAVTPEVATITTLELAKIGLQLDTKGQFNNSTINLVKYVYRNQGIRGLMCGWQGVQTRQMLWTGTYFATLDSFRRGCTDLWNKPVVKNSMPDHVINFAAGFLAGVAGAAVNTPVDVIRTTIQKEGLAEMTNPNAHKTRNAVDFSRILSVGKNIVAQRGFGTLYNGLFFKCLHMGSSGACVAVLIPWFARLFGIKRDIM